MKRDEDLPPQADELPALLENLSYELWMLDECAKTVAGGNLADAEQNAWLEAFVIHARVLTEFFGDKPIKDDVVAKHYVGTDWRDADATTALEALRTQVGEWHKWLAHLTATRVRKSKPRHNIGEIHADLVALNRRFAEELKRRSNP